MRGFGVAGFTAGAVTIAPRLSSAVLRASKAGEWREAERLLEAIIPLETLRNEWGPIRTIHEAVTLSGVADCGPVLPLLSPLDESQRARLAEAVELLARAEATMAASVREIGTAWA